MKIKNNPRLFFIFLTNQLFLNPSHDLLKLRLMLAHDGHDGCLLGNSLFFLGFNLVLDLLEEVRIFRDDFQKLFDLLFVHACGL
ncbi:MAG: hypothetical protein JWM20_220 [Patescibacteria group bacterium]|nr:hypothetical protein [Patescibacteria group bacterium]